MPKNVLRAFFFTFISGIFFVSASSVFATPFSGGSGTSGDPYIITTCNQLQLMRDNLSANYKLGNDIDCDVAPYNTGVGFFSIGNSSNAFTSTFDGADHTISNLFINNASNSFVGLFGYVNGATLKNVELENVDIAGYEYVGGLVGYESGSTIDTVSVSGSVSSTGSANNSYVGGVIGYTLNGTITNAYSNAAVTASKPGSSSSIAGGLVGVSQLTIKNSYATGNVTTNGSSGSAGGLIGESAANVSVMDNSFATGVVSGNDSGFLIGQCNFGTVTNSYAIDEPLCGTSGSTTISDSQGSVLLSNFYQKPPLHAVYTGTPAWDFDNTWAFNDTSSLPVFTWQVISTPSGNSGSSSGDSSSAPSCTDAMPTSAPNLFQLSTKGLTTTLFFSPVSGSNSSYVISYGFDENADNFATSFNYSDASGVIPYSINYLFPGKWFFKVRGQNGCMPGEWSQVRSVNVL